MMKKTLLSSTILLVAAGIAAPSFAQWTISAGVQSTTMNVDSEMEIQNADGIAGFENEAVSSNEDTGVSGELAVGYQYNFNDTYNVALELFGQLNDANVRVPVYLSSGDEFSDNHANISTDWIAGLRLRPGYNVTPSTRLFVDGGIVLGRFEVEYSDGIESSLGINDGSNSSTLTGWRYGAGVEHKFMDNFAVGLDYTITSFEELDAEHAEDALAPADLGTSASLDYTPTLYTLGLNLKYLFGAKKQPKRHYEMRDK